MKEVGKTQTDCEVRFRLPVFDPGNVFLVAFQGRSKRFLCLILRLAVRLDVVSEYLVNLFGRDNLLRIFHRHFLMYFLQKRNSPIEIIMVFLAYRLD